MGPVFMNHSVRVHGHSGRGLTGRWQTETCVPQGGHEDLPRRFVGQRHVAALAKQLLPAHTTVEVLVNTPATERR